MTIQRIASTSASTSQALPDSIRQAPSPVQANICRIQQESSLVSLSCPQQEGEDWDTALWNLVTWPFTLLASFWKWLTETKESVAVVKKPAKDFRPLFCKEEFDVSACKKIYQRLSKTEQKAFRAILWVASGFPEDEERKDWAVEFLKQKKYNEEERAFLKAAAELHTALPGIKSHAQRVEKLVEKMAAEDYGTDFDPDIAKLKADCGKWPKLANLRAECLRIIYEPQVELNAEDVEEEEDLVDASRLAVVSHVLKILAQNHYLAVANATARAELRTMLERLAELDEEAPITIEDFTLEYDRLGSFASQALDDLIGYRIGRPEEGENYLFGLLEVDDATVVPDVNILLDSLKNLVVFDGGRIPLHWL